MSACLIKKNMDEKKEKVAWIIFLVLMGVVFLISQSIERRINKELSAYSFLGYSEAIDEKVKSWKVIHRSFVVNDKYAFSLSLEPREGPKDDSVYLGTGDHFWKNKNSDTMYITRGLDTFFYIFDANEMK